MQDLRDRGRHGRFWLYLALDPRTGALVLETSWLPDVPEVKTVLRPLGFRRRPDGSYRRSFSKEERTDRLGILRAATKALGVLLDEEVRS